MHKTNKTTEPKWPRGNCAMRGCQHSVNYCYIVSQNRFSKDFVPNKLKKRKKVSIVQLQAEILRNRIDAAKKM